MALAASAPRQPVQRGLLIARARQLHVPVRLLDLDARRDGHGQFSLWAFHLQLFANRYLDAFRQWNRLVSNS